MKKFFRFVLIFVLLLSFTGCRTLHQAEEYIDHKLDVAEDQAEQAFLLYQRVEQIGQLQQPIVTSADQLMQMLHPWLPL